MSAHRKREAPLPLPPEAPINNCLSWCSLPALLLQGWRLQIILHHIWQRGDNHFSRSNRPWNLTFLQAQRTPWNSQGFPSIPVLPAVLNNCYLEVVTFSTPLEYFPTPTCLFVSDPLCHMLSFLFSDQISIGPDHG